jgi:centrosomal protein CEP135
MEGERRFLLLKKRLDALHYCQPLSMDSAALVEKLLNDLVKTTEGFQQMKKM